MMSFNRLSYGIIGDLNTNRIIFWDFWDLANLSDLALEIQSFLPSFKIIDQDTLSSVSYSFETSNNVTKSFTLDLENDCLCYAFYTKTLFRCPRKELFKKFVRAF